MNLLFFPLLAGHLVAEFWIQPNMLGVQKMEDGIKSSKLVFHVAIASMLPVVFTFQLNLWWFVPIIFITHILIDFFKTKLKDNIVSFLFGQLLHITVLWVLAFGATKMQLSVNTHVFWIYASGFILITNPVGIFTGKFLNIVIQNKKKTLKIDISGWIGIMERILILAFITTGQLSAVGFLIAAKSVFRFNDTREDGSKKTEYFLLGTLISFAFATVVGLTINYLVGLDY